MQYLRGGIKLSWSHSSLTDLMMFGTDNYCSYCHDCRYYMLVTSEREGDNERTVSH